MKKLTKVILGIVAGTTAICSVAALGACNSGEHQHSWDDGTVTTAPTCTEDGVKTFHCTVDGCDETKTEVIDAKGHAWDNGSVTTEPTCTVDGVKTFHCTVDGCDGTKTEAVTAPGHTWDDDWTITAPTNDDPGLAVKHCTVDDCNGVKEVVLPVLSDTAYTTGEDSATCLVGGKMTYTITKDNETISFDVVTSPKGHTWDDNWTITPPTDDGTGLAVKHCKVDGCNGVKEVVLPVLSDTAYTVTEEPASCTALGKKTYTITKDDETITFAVATPMLPHTYDFVVTDPDVDTQGEISKSCTVCHQPLSDSSYKFDEMLEFSANATQAITTDTALVKINRYAEGTSGGTAPHYVTFTADKVGIYHFEFTHLVSNVTALQTLYVNDVNALSSATVKRAGTSGRSSVLSIEIELAANDVFKMYLNCNMGTDTDMMYYMVDTTFTATVPKLKVGDNTVVITKDHTSYDKMTFTSTEAKTYSFTAGDGLGVCLMKNYNEDTGDFDLDDLILSDATQRYVNIAVGAGEKITLVFNADAIGNYTLTVGDEILDNKLKVGEAMNVSVPSGKDADNVVAITVGDGVAEGKYNLTITYSNVLGRSYLLLAVNGDDVTYADLYGTNSIDGCGVALQFGQFFTQHPEIYEGNTKTRGQYLVTVTLKAGDVIYLAQSGMTAGNITITMTPVEA